MEKKLSLSIEVTEFAVPLQQTGDLDRLAGGLGLGAEFGQARHHQILDSLEGEKEVPVKYIYRRPEASLVVVGRADCVDRGLGRLIEVKTTHQFEVLKRQIEEDAWHPFKLQLMTYARLMPGEWDCEIHLASYRDDGFAVLPVNIPSVDFEIWFEKRCRQLILIEKMRLRRKKLRQMGERAQFPYTEKRPGQEEMIEFAGRTKPKVAALQAPTGLGKTTAVLYGALLQMKETGKRIVWLTPKNSQQSLVIKELAEIGDRWQTLVLTSRSKICMKDKVDCRPKVCEFANRHYDKVNEHRLERRLRSLKKIDKEVLTKWAESYQVCPYELQRPLMKWADVVVGDMNYVFSRVTALPSLLFSGREKNILVVDESHNLPHRVRDEYSAEIVPVGSESPIRFQQGYQSFLEWTKNKAEESLLWKTSELLREGIAQLLQSDTDLVECESLLEFYSAVQLLLLGLQMETSPFAVIAEPQNGFKVICLDAGEFISECLAGFSNAVFFSATLKPFESFRCQIGVEKMRELELASSYPKDNRKVVLIPQVSSRVRVQEKHLEKMKEVIERLVVLKRGNYLVFSPSYKLTEKLADVVEVDGFEKIVQEKGWQKQDVDDLLVALKRETNHLVFAVQGGVLAEGIDYRGDLAIGCFVIGPGLPQFDEVNQLKSDYFQKKFGKGFAMTYALPAMTRSIQSAGRVIRSESDRGLLVFLDDRFLQPEYFSAFPEDWVSEGKDKLVSQSIIKDIEEFWAR